MKRALQVYMWFLVLSLGFVAAPAMAQNWSEWGTASGSYLQFRTQCQGTERLVQLKQESPESYAYNWKFESEKHPQSTGNIVLSGYSFEILTFQVPAGCKKFKLEVTQLAASRKDASAQMTYDGVSVKSKVKGGSGGFGFGDAIAALAAGVAAGASGVYVPPPDTTSGRGNPADEPGSVSAESAGRTAGQISVPTQNRCIKVTGGYNGSQRIDYRFQNLCGQAVMFRSCWQNYGQATGDQFFDSACEGLPGQMIAAGDSYYHEFPSQGRYSFRFLAIGYADYRAVGIQGSDLMNNQSLFQSISSIPLAPTPQGQGRVN